MDQPTVPAQTPDDAATPGRRGFRSLALTLLLVLSLAGVVIKQQYTPAAGRAEARERRALAEVGGGEISPPGVDQAALFAKLHLAMKEFPPPLNTTSLQFASGAEAGALASRSAAERIRAAILISEVAGPEAATQRLDDVERGGDPTHLPEGSFAPRPFQPLAEDSPLRADVTALRALFSGADAASIDEESRAGLIERHGLLARLALSRGAPDDPVRISARSDGIALVLVFGLFGFIVMMAMVGGLIALILLAIFVGTRRLRPLLTRSDAAGDDTASRAQFPSPSRLDPTAEAPHAIWLETAAVFVAAFLLLQIVGDLLSGLVPAAPLTLGTLAAQLAMAVLIFWPVVRGVPFARFRRELGWHSGRGVLKEIGWGLLFYFAGLPVLLFMALCVALLMLLKQTVRHAMGLDPTPISDNKILDLVGSGNPVLIVFLFLMATVWAPIVEEAIFRGALYRHLRARIGVVLSILITAAVFALMHGYMIEQLLIVGTLGAVFAVMREFRSSLIPSTTAHFLHNFTVLCLLLTVFSFAGG